MFNNRNRKCGFGQPGGRSLFTQNVVSFNLIPGGCSALFIFGSCGMYLLVGLKGRVTI